MFIKESQSSFSNDKGKVFIVQKNFNIVHTNLLHHKAVQAHVTVKMTVWGKIKNYLIDITCKH